MSLAPWNRHEEQTVLHIAAVNGIGGAEKLLTDLLPALKKSGQPIACAILYKQPFEQSAKAIGETLKRQGIPVFYAAYRHVFSRRPLSFIRSLLAAGKPALIHTHLKHAELWLAWLKWRRKVQLPVVSTIHGYRDGYMAQHGLEYKPSIKCSYYYWLTRFVGNQLNGFIAISNGVSNLFCRAKMVSAKKVVTIYHGTAMKASNPPILKRPRPDLVILGRLVAFKGHRYAVNAVEKLRKRYPDVQLHIYGLGPEEKKLRTQVEAKGLQNHVIFHGFVQDVHSRLVNHSIAFVPSRGEPFGLVLFDAFHAGLPVVAFDVPALNEIITNRKNGLLARPGTGDGLADAVEQLLEDDSLYNRIVEQAYLCMQTDFSLEQMTSSYVHFYKKYMHS